MNEWSHHRQEPGGWQCTGLPVDGFQPVAGAGSTIQGITFIPPDYGTFDESRLASPVFFLQLYLDKDTEIDILLCIS